MAVGAISDGRRMRLMLLTTKYGTEHYTRGHGALGHRGGPWGRRAFGRTCTSTPVLRSSMCSDREKKSTYALVPEYTAYSGSPASVSGLAHGRERRHAARHGTARRTTGDEAGRRANVENRAALAIQLSPPRPTPTPTPALPWLEPAERRQRQTAGPHHAREKHAGHAREGSDVDGDQAVHQRVVNLAQKGRVVIADPDIVHLSEHPAHRPHATTASANRAPTGACGPR
jgi:hypothetical protein